MKKNKKQPDAGGNWMDTYGDMVTLLLTFFVMLYSMSSVNEQKWEMFVRSISPQQENASSADGDMDVVVNGKADIADSKKDNTEAGDPEIPKNSVDDVSRLYLQLAENFDAQGIEGVDITRGPDYTFILFRDKTFFDGDKSVLKEQGKKTLDIFCSTIGGFGKSLSQIMIMGHTAQAEQHTQNRVRKDRMLSSMRATEVGVYIQEKNIVPSKSIVTVGYGQFRPIAPNDIENNRKKNRRVEILMLDKGAKVKNLDDYYEEIRSLRDESIVTDGKKKDSSYYEGLRESAEEKKRDAVAASVKTSEQLPEEQK